MEDVLVVTGTQFYELSLCMVTCDKCHCVSCGSYPPPPPHYNFYLLLYFFDVPVACLRL